LTLRLRAFSLARANSLAKNIPHLLAVNPYPLFSHFLNVSFAFFRLSDYQEALEIQELFKIVAHFPPPLKELF